MNAGISKNNLICCSICKNVRINVLFATGIRDRQAGTLNLVKSSTLCGLSILEGNSYLASYNTAKRNRATVCRLNSKSGNNGSPYAVVEYLDLCVVTSGFFTTVVEWIEGHQVKLVGIFKRDFQRVSIRSCICYSVSCRLIAVKCIIKVGYTGVNGSARKSDLILCSAEKDVLSSSNLSYIIAAAGHLTYTDIVTAEGLT